MYVSVRAKVGLIWQDEVESVCGIALGRSHRLCPRLKQTSSLPTQNSKRQTQKPRLILQIIKHKTQAFYLTSDFFSNFSTKMLMYEVISLNTISHITQAIA